MVGRDEGGRQVVIVGGGITGLSAAHTLIRKTPRVDVVLVEREGRLGGKILTERTDGFVIEGGPDSFLASKPSGLQLCRQLGIESELQGTDERHRHTFVMHGGHLYPMPEGLSGLVPSRLDPLVRSDLFTFGGKRRMQEEHTIPPRLDGGDESLADFIERRFGLEVYERLIEPLMAGIYAGDGRRLSLLATFPTLHTMEAEYGSILAAMQARQAQTATSSEPRSGFLAPRRGMAEIVEALQRQLGGVRRLQSEVRSVESDGTGYALTCTDGTRLRAGAVILAIPAHVSAEILEPVDAQLAAALGGVPYVSSATVSLAFRCAELGHDLDGYGYVIPRAEGSPALASTWVSSKWRARAPEGYALIRVFIGRAGLEDMLRGSDGDLIALARDELRETLGIDAAPILTRVFRWPRAMPQYNLGHVERLREIDTRLERHPGLFLAGAAYRGVGIPDCIASGQDAAAAALQNLKATAAT